MSHLPDEKQEELLAIIDAARRLLPVKMIILFGSFARGDWVEDRYVEDGITYEYQSDFDLLFIVGSEKIARKFHYTSSLENRITSGLKKRLHKNNITPLSIIFHGMDYFRSEIKDGSYFFVDILKEGIILWSEREYLLAKPRKLFSSERLKKAELYYDSWFEKADGFFKVYRFAYGEEMLVNAIFQLHQAAEHYYMAALLVLTDYKPKTHDLEKLNRDICELDSRFKTVFSLDSKKERDLFLILKDAYIDSRYKLNYTVESSVLYYLSRKVQELQTVTAELCRNKLRKLRSESALEKKDLKIRREKRRRMKAIAKQQREANSDS